MTDVLKIEPEVFWIEGEIQIILKYFNFEAYKVVSSLMT